MHKFITQDTNLLEIRRFHGGFIFRKRLRTWIKMQMQKKKNFQIRLEKWFADLIKLIGAERTDIKNE